MRRIAAVLFLLAVSLSAPAEDLLGPADYLKILTESKQRYNLVTQPSKTPAPQMDCPRRDLNTRLRVNGAKKTLEAWTIKPEAQELLDEGEKAFQAKQYDVAAEKYKAATVADPEAAGAYYFYGDALLFGAHDAAGALAQYEKGLALDPSMPAGHMFAATALVHLGRSDEAREQIVKALALYPSYDAVWNVAGTVYDRWNARPPVRYPFDVPAGYLGAKGKNGVDIYMGPEGRWLGYAVCKAVWANEPQFAKRHGGDGAGWSLDEERACVLNQLQSMYNSTEANLEEAQKKNGVAKPDVKEADIIAALPPLEKHLFDVAQAHLLDGYIAFAIIGEHCPIALSMLPDSVQKEIEEYVRTYVIVKR
jgi:tetratricopeptide (TPR) repeat protein